MAEACVVGVYKSLAEAQAAAHILHRADFPREQMILVGSSTERSAHMVEDLSMGDDSVNDAAWGAGVGGVLGVLTGTTAGALSGIAVLLVAGPAAGALTGALLGAFLASLVGWGVHKSQVAHYENYLKSGNALLIAEGDPVAVARADRILRETDAVALDVHARDSSDAPEIVESRQPTTE
jgi:hypothetical protein